MEKNEIKTFKEAIKSLCEYMSNHGLNVKPLPKIRLNNEKQDGLFIKTGYYSPEDKEIVVFINGRAIKDCARTCSHELIHHHQNLRGDNLSFTNEDNVKDNKELEKLESEAYLKGNVFFRKWTEHFKNNKKENLNEGRKKIVKNDKGEIVPDICPECGSEVGLYIKGEPVYLCSNEKCKKYFGGMPFNLNEITANDVDLSSFKLKRELNSKFWIDGHLDKRIRLKLLDLADDFFKELDIDWVEPKDIILTGSLANYNWNKKHSDIDLHILLDYKDVDDNVDFVKSYFDAKKKLWNEKHEGLTIYGFQVEVYVQDINEKHNSSGVYSLDKDKWIDEPNYDELNSHKIDSKTIKNNVAKYINEIDNLIDDFKSAGDDLHKNKIIHKNASKLFDKIKNERTKGFSKDSSEMNTGNLTFKALRRMDYIGKLVDLIEKTYNIINSLD